MEPAGPRASNPDSTGVVAAHPAESPDRLSSRVAGWGARPATGSVAARLGLRRPERPGPARRSAARDLELYGLDPAAFRAQLVGSLARLGGDVAGLGGLDLAALQVEVDRRADAALRRRRAA